MRVATHACMQCTCVCPPLPPPLSSPVLFSLMCSASYVEFGEAKTLPQFFKFTAANPLSVKTKVRVVKVRAGWGRGEERGDEGGAETRVWVCTCASEDGLGSPAGCCKVSLDC